MKEDVQVTTIAILLYSTLFCLINDPTSPLSNGALWIVLIFYLKLVIKIFPSNPIIEK
jgi:hypothetical protein